MSEAGIDEDDLARIAAFNGEGSSHPYQLAGSSANGGILSSRGSPDANPGPKSLAVADHLRERLDDGERLVTNSRAIARKMDGRTPDSIGQSLKYLVGSDVGVTVEPGERFYDEGGGRQRWIITRSDGDDA